jgi:hypothetical protein
MLTHAVTSTEKHVRQCITEVTGFRPQEWTEEILASTKTIPTKPYSQSSNLLMGYLSKLLKTYSLQLGFRQGSEWAGMCHDETATTRCARRGQKPAHEHFCAFAADGEDEPGTMHFGPGGP